MNTKRFLLAVVAVFVFVNFFEMLYHQYLVGELYGQTAELWCPTETMEDYMLWMWIGYALLSVMFCYIFLTEKTNLKLQQINFLNTNIAFLKEKNI